MKKFSFLLLFCFLLSITIFAQSWELQNTNVPANATIGPFSPVNDDICWACWTTGAPNHINGYLKTTDGGSTWACDTIQEVEGGTIPWIDALDANTAFIVSQFYGPGIYKTTDGGVTWQKNPTAYSSAVYGPEYIHFFDSNNGVCVGDPEFDIQQVKDDGFQIYTTSDGGTDWNEVPNDNIAHALTVEYPYAIEVAEVGDCIWLSTIENYVLNPRIFRTTDKGYTWTAKSQDVIDLDYRMSTAFQNETTGMVLAWSTTTLSTIIRKTTDGGETWNDVPGPYGCIPVNIAYVPGTPSTYVISGDNNVVYYANGSAYTLDGGETWTKLDKGNHYYLTFNSSKVGWSTRWLTNNIYKYVGSEITSADDKIINNLPTDYSLKQNYPNPFNPSTTIKYSIPIASKVIVKIYDVLGNEIETLVNEDEPAEKYETEFNAALLPSGVYFYQLSATGGAGSFLQTKKMILLK